ncbi:MAG: type II toxin-antitoxin system Phd/YefM family antitoxin [Sulfuricella sp.]|nr:type II toxin-antitoxin system Phd/YefM family antitoxin [Sulfuricella sp.]
MKTATATEVKSKFGLYLDIAQREPVMIEKSGRQAVVLISAEEYAHLQSLEDLALSRKIRDAIAEGYAGVEETQHFLAEMEERHGGA